MKPLLLTIVVLLSIGPMAARVRGQEAADYKGWMKQANEASGSLRKELKGKMGDAAAEDANTLAGIFAQVEQFWQKRNAADAVKFAADAASGFKQVSDLTKAGKFDDASAALKSSEANCTGCHKAHRAMTIHGPELK